MTLWRRRVRHVRFGLQAIFSGAVILLAVVVGLMQLALPWIASHPERVANFLAERLGKPVAIEQVEGHWERNGPLLSLHGLHIGPQRNQAELLIPQAELKINLFPWLYRNERWNELRLSGLDLHLARDAGGSWSLRGFGNEGGDTQGDPGVLFDLGALVLSNLRVQIDDAVTGRNLRLGADEVRLINSGSRHRVLAHVHQLELPAQSIDAAIDYDSDDHTVEVYAGAKSVDVAAMVGSTPVFGSQLERASGNLQWWGWWQGPQLIESRAEVTLTSVLLDAKNIIALDEKRQIAPRVSFDRIALGARWQRKDSGWTLDVDDLELEQQGRRADPASVHVEKVQASDAALAEYFMHAKNVEVDAPASIAMLTDALPESWRRWLYAANPDGMLRDATLRFTGADDFDVAAQISGFAWHALDKLPGVDGLGATILGDQGAITLTLPQRTFFSVNEPHVFRLPLEFNEFSGTVCAYRIDDAWRVETTALTFDNPRFGGELTGAIELRDDGAKPLLDVAAVVTHGEVPASHLFWPINVMPPPAIAWLDRALDSGKILGAQAVLRGDLTDWPFRNYAGRFEGRAQLDDMRLRYLPDWPAAEHVHADADFVNTGLRVETSAAQAMGTKITAAVADIDDLGDAMLDLKIAAQGSGKDLLAFVKASPLGTQFATPLLGVDIGGQDKIDFQLRLPVKHAEDKVLVGTIELADADLADAKYDLHLAKANGKVRFSDHGFSADALDVRMQDHPAVFGLQVGAFVADKRHVVEATLGADVSAQTVLAYAPVLAPYAERISGDAHFDVAFNADASPGTAQRLTVTSDLAGVAIDLPAPLNKPADSALPMNLELGLPFATGSIDFALGDLAHMRGRLASDKQAFAARVNFGANADGALPKSGFLIGGDAPLVDLSGWMDFAVSNSTGGGGSNILAGIDVHTERLRVYDRDFGVASFRLTPATDRLDLTFSGANIDGSLQIPTENLRQRGVTLQFNRLYWPDSAETETSALAGENPAVVPPLHIHIGDFRLGNGNFGDTQVESYPIPQGMRFEQVATHSPNVQMRAHGDWTGLPGSDFSAFSIELTAKNLGRMLDAFGYAGLVDGGETVAHIEGRWKGSPSTFALTRLDGTLKVSVGEGRIPDTSPGAGRIFGLFNLAAIPRRLTLDFGDLFKSGFSFDSINALFTLKEGDAFTKDLQIKGPAADIAISGRTGLKSKDVDQEMQVTPHVGGTLAVGGALIGGPVGAAAGVLLQGVFKNVAKAHYKVSGSLEKPTITQLDVQGSHPSRAQKPKSTIAPPAPVEKTAESALQPG